MRHLGPVSEHHLGSPGRRRGTQLPKYVTNIARQQPFPLIQGSYMTASSVLLTPGLRTFSFQEEVLVETSPRASHGVTPAQINLASLMARGIVPCPSSIKLVNFAANLVAVEIRLSGSEKFEIADLERVERQVVPEIEPAWDV